MAATQRVLLDGVTTWTVVSESLLVVEPVEQYLEFGRQNGFAPNTIKAYARSLAQWWSFLEKTSKSWDAVQIRDFGSFLAAVRHNDLESNVRLLRPQPVVAENTVRLRLHAVLAFYRYQAGCGNDVAPFLYDQVRGRSTSYLAFLQHTTGRKAQRRPAVRVRLPRTGIPILSPEVVADLLDEEAVYSSERAEWTGDFRYRLLWAVLAETGMRLGEALSLQHRDWNTGRSSTATVSIVERPHPYGLATKSGARRVHIGSRLDRLYADYVWWLCDQGADALVEDWDSAYIFCNTRRQPLFGPLRPESVYAHLRAVKRRLPQLPAAMTPHWFRHTHATALLLANTPLHVVSRRLGHQSVQTTINTYGHVTEDAELEALANWREVVAGWEANRDGN
ncbi:tyrosine-type recombinase/integrase [Mycobacterium frederiksbergense]|uniref:site-specific integrase n=1 Tax=Mycolicibacterium frederiksbergense TaxID=117567 RepID=UPI0021F2C0FA|nr:site-specific integrase [Mycolicibacterium frederiksbergense]MCV7046458.1 tyrosine-type recombinase/integrase [Mycolicibacterium frederiksbergense]